MELFGLFVGQKTYGKEDFLSTTSQFESMINSAICETYLVDVASKLRNMLKRGDVVLQRSEKIRLLKALNKAKVKALLQKSTGEGYRVFRSLDSITNDMLMLL